MKSGSLVEPEFFGENMARRGLRKLAWFPPIGVSRAIYRAFSDDKDLAKTFFDLLKNTAVTAAAFGLLLVLISKGHGYQAWVGGTLLGMGVWIASLALVAQSLHHFGRTFRRRIAEILYPELAHNPIVNDNPAFDLRVVGRRHIRFAKQFYVPASIRSFAEILLVSAFAYGFVVLLVISFAFYGIDVAKKLS